MTKRFEALTASMYIPPAYNESDPARLRAMIRAVGLATLVTATDDGMLATPLPLLLDDAEGPQGVLLGHLARANSQWRIPANGEALAVFTGANAYVTPSWYASKAATGKVVPTWIYLAIHVYGQVEFFEDEGRILDVVSRLTSLHEKNRAVPWAVSDAPEAYIRSLLGQIVGVRLTIARIEGARKLEQEASPEDRRGVATGLAGSDNAAERRLAPLIPVDDPGALR